MMRQSKTARLIAALFVLVALGGGEASGAGAVPRRIVSLNLCADEYLIALADRDQIAGLTFNAVNPDMSTVAEEARGLPLVKGSAEEVLVLKPDLVVGMPAPRIGPTPYRTLDLQTADSLADIEREIRKVAVAVGHPDRGEALIARMEADLATAPRAGRGRVGAYYQRRGYLTGAGTLVDEIMARAGLVNLASRLGKAPLYHLSVEEMVAARPDFLIVEAATDRVTDQGVEMLHHPALRDIPRLRLPEAWTVCGGPAYVRAVRSLGEQLKARELGAR
jgi:iron complex transport system substrate-binding protein